MDYTVESNIITPDSNYYGDLTVTVTVNDGVAKLASAPYDLTVTINPVNDAPVITGQMVLSVVEEKPLEIVVDSLIVTDPDNDTFTLTVLDSANYSISGNTITSDVGFLGDLSVYVQVDDGESKELSDIYILTVTVVEDTGIESSIPHTTTLYQNYPNPFNPTTTIEYEIINDCKVEVMVYNNSGMLVKELVNDHKTAGKYSVVFDASYLPSGMYYYQMKADGFQKFNKSILIK
ncbi:MAG: T9SS type A sorting domain-containing protein, partial [Candidatus Delongbacteria bacterium]|nr:T9SS type A sorting domain-containing protein [Candidatus Delongbacteria bacterium]